MKYIYYIISICLFLTSGCASLRGTKANTTNQKSISRQEQKALDIDSDIRYNLNQQIQQSAVYAYGVKYSLSQIDNPAIEVVTASKLNDRVVAIVGAPTLKEAERIKKITDYLNSEIASERIKGQKALEEKDKEIVKLQSEKFLLQKQYDSQIDKLISEAKNVAKSADEKQTTLDSMSGFLGLNAVFWGLKKFFFTSLTWIVVFCIIFIILRIASATNPIAAAAFSIFNIIGSFVINLLKGLTPKAFDLSNFVKTNEMVKYKITLTKIVNVIQAFKIKEDEKEGDNFSLNEFLNDLAKEMDSSEKEVVQQILKEEKW